MARKKRAPVIRLVDIRDRKDRELVTGQVKAVLESHGPDIEGFAFIVWDRTLRSTCSGRTKANRIPAILIPDFVRNRLLAERIVDWAVDETLDRLVKG